MILIRRLPVRRVELLFSLAAVLGSGSLVWVARPAGELSSWLALFILEALLPLAFGAVAAGLLAGDPAVELLLTAHRPAWVILAERLVYLLGVGGLTGLALHLTLRQWEVALPKESTDQLFIWLSPLVFCIGLGSAAALLRGRMLDGALAVILAVSAALLTLTQIPQLCPQASQQLACPGWLLSPTMTIGAAIDRYWGLNRLVWLAVGVGLLALSLRLARREEPLLQDEGG